MGRIKFCGILELLDGIVALLVEAVEVGLIGVEAIVIEGSQSVADGVNASQVIRDLIMQA